jgi:hypothetical protein
LLACDQVVHHELAARDFISKVVVRNIVDRVALAVVLSAIALTLCERLSVRLL